MDLSRDRTALDEVARPPLGLVLLAPDDPLRSSRLFRCARAPAPESSARLHHPHSKETPCAALGDDPPTQRSSHAAQARSAAPSVATPPRRGTRCWQDSIATGTIAASARKTKSALSLC